MPEPRKLETNWGCLAALLFTIAFWTTSFVFIWLVLGWDWFLSTILAMIFVLIVLPTKYDPAIKIKELTERIIQGD